MKKYFSVITIELLLLVAIICSVGFIEKDTEKTTVKTVKTVENDTLISRQLLIGMFEEQYKNIQNKTNEIEKQKGELEKEKIKIMGRLEMLYGIGQDSIRVKR